MRPTTDLSLRSRGPLVPWGALLLAACATACGGRVPVGEHDAGSGGDSGTALDGGPLLGDGGSAADASGGDAGLRDDDAGISADAGTEDDAATADAGWCECPPPLPGCRWVGVPCACTDYVCDDAGAPRPCGGFAGLTCAADEYCDYAEPHGCGAADESGICQPRPTACPPVIAEVCGCDGMTYSSRCDAHAAGIDAVRDGACGAPDCAPEDARGEGFCAAIVGIAWDGGACRWLSGCSCVGADCGRWSTIEECETAHAHCPTVPPLPPVPE